MTALATNDLQPAPLPRPRNVTLGTSLGVAAILVYFGGLFGIYFAERALVRNAGGDWIPVDADMELTPGTVMAWTLLMSIVTMQWAVHAIKADDRKHAYLALGVNAIFAAAVINQTVWQYKQMGLVADDSRAATLIYAISGSHVAMLVVALIYFVVMAFRTLGGQYSSKYADGFQAAAIFWYAAVFIYQIIWIGIWIGK